MLPLLLSLNQPDQIPLFRISYQDHEDLLNNPKAKWYEVLYKLPWEYYRVFGAMYYDALRQFNKNADLKRQESKSESNKSESKEKARQRLLFDRVTMQKQSEEKAIIYQQEYEEIIESKVDPESIAPGVSTSKRRGLLGIVWVNLPTNHISGKQQVNTFSRKYSSSLRP